MDDLKLIKKHYGENMMHLCRELFPTLIEKGVLFEVLSRKFDYSKFLYEDIIKEDKEADFKNLIYSQVDVENNYIIKTNKTPEELLNEAGYNFYECRSEEDIQSFKKYYSSGEELCTFYSDRLKSCRVFFAVKKDVDKIKRKNFSKPERQDLYGTSVISIQFSNGDKNTLSIKNRYNHTVNNPDATFSNNLDNIIPGLTEAFERVYNLDINSNKGNFELNNYVLARDDRYYKYNLENFNIYYCPNNIIIDQNKHEIKRYEKEKYIVFDYFVLDLINKKIIQYDSVFTDSFIDSIGHIDKININVDKKYKKVIINDKIVLTLNMQNQMIKYKNEIVSIINRCFLQKDKYLEEVNLPNVKRICDNFLCDNECLKKISLKKVEEIEQFFLNKNTCLRKIDFPNLKIIYPDFMTYNSVINEVNLPKVEKIGSFFLINSSSLESIDLPNVRNIGAGFMKFSINLKKISAPKLEKISENFLCEYPFDFNKYLNNIELDIPKLKKKTYK